MKRICSLILALLLLMSLTLVAWAQAAPTPEVAAADDVDDWLFEDDADDWDTEAEDDVDWDDLEWDDDDMLDTDDTVEDTLFGAMEVYSWFVMQPLDVDPEKPDSAGTHFQVLDERFNTMQLLHDYVSTQFSDAIVEDLFEMNVYVEENGFLYTTSEGRNIDENIGETEFEVLEETPDKVTYNVTVYYWDTEDSVEEEFTYVREHIGGEWKFTEFPFFW